MLAYIEVIVLRRVDKWHLVITYNIHSNSAFYC